MVHAVLSMSKLKPKKAVSVSHPYDDPENFCSPGIFRAPLFNKEKYQQELNKILGVSADGYPICRLSWAWECRRWTNYGWDDHGVATKGEWRQRYKALTVQVGDDEYVDISPPRWVLEERFEPGQIERSWEQSRYFHDPVECRRCVNRAALLAGLMGRCVNRFVPDHEARGCGLCHREFNTLDDSASTSCTRRDVWGPTPREGWYNLVPHIGMVAEHELSKRCCDRLWKQSKEICYGRYKVPDGRELQVLREAVARRDENPEANPHAELDEQALASARQWGLDAINEKKIAARTEMKDFWKDEVETHGAKLCTPFELEALKSMGLKPPRMGEIFTP